MKDCGLTHGINLARLQEKVFGNQFSSFDSPRDHPQRIHSDNVQRNRKAVEAGRTKTSHTSEDINNQGTIPMPPFATRPLSTRSTIPVELPQNFMESTNFLIHSRFQCGKFASQLKWTICSDVPSDAMLWIKEVDLVDSLDELKSSRSVSGKDFPNFEMLDAKIASALNKIIQNSQLKKKVNFGAESPDGGPVSTRKTDSFHDLRLISSDWCS